MLLAATYTFGDGLLTVLEIALLFLWIWIAIGVVLDIFRSHDLSGWGKALWLLFIVILPLLGVLIYLIVRGRGMHERTVGTARSQDEAFRQYVRRAAASPADDLAKLADLRDRGVLTEEEFQSAKAKALGGT
jgi:hypothetical protein